MCHTHTHTHLFATAFDWRRFSLFHFHFFFVSSLFLSFPSSLLFSLFPLPFPFFQTTKQHSQTGTTTTLLLSPVTFLSFTQLRAYSSVLRLPVQPTLAPFPQAHSLPSFLLSFFLFSLEFLGGKNTLLHRCGISVSFHTSFSLKNDVKGSAKKN